MHACAKGLGVSSLTFAVQPTAPMENVIVDLAAALRERLAIIGDKQSRRNPEAHLARLQVVSDKIDKVQRALPSPVDPQLAHYLQRKSYDKALEFIENTTRRSTVR
jgi:hypothetical protein